MFMEVMGASGGLQQTEDLKTFIHIVLDGRTWKVGICCTHYMIRDVLLRCGSMGCSDALVKDNLGQRPPG